MGERYHETTQFLLNFLKACDNKCFFAAPEIVYRHSIINNSDSQKPKVLIFNITMLHSWLYHSIHTQALIWIQQSDPGLFCNNYAKLYFDAKHLNVGLNKEC